MAATGDTRGSGSSSPGRYGSWRGTLVSYAIIAALSGTGSLVTPFVKAIGQTLLWTALPNGKRATF